MKLHFWNGPNFGDQLNLYIFPELFPDLLSAAEDGRLLCGIGSIIEENLIPDGQNIIIFGSGMRYPIYKGDRTGWDIRFLRGPLSANCLSRPNDYIADAAYCLSLIDDFKTLTCASKKKYKTSLIPYFSYAPLFPWQRVCNLVGVNYIDPTGHPKDIIKEVLSSEQIIAGAMHGAIVADVCRVPWIRLRMDQFPTENSLTTEFKWADWMLSLGLKTHPCVKLSSVDLQGTTKIFSKTLFALEAILKLRDRSGAVYQLTKDDVLSSVTRKLTSAISSLREDYQQLNVPLAAQNMKLPESIT